MSPSVWILLTSLVSYYSNEENKDLKLVFPLVPGLNTIEYYNIIQVDLEYGVLLTRNIKKREMIVIKYVREVFIE